MEDSRYDWFSVGDEASSFVAEIALACEEGMVSDVVRSGRQ